MMFSSVNIFKKTYRCKISYLRNIQCSLNCRGVDPQTQQPPETSGCLTFRMVVRMFRGKMRHLW